MKRYTLILLAVCSVLSVLAQTARTFKLPLADGQTLPLYRGGSFWLKVRAFFSGKYPLLRRARGEGKELALRCPVESVLERVRHAAESQR